jgi:hypothetical protein
METGGAESLGQEMGSWDMDSDGGGIPMEDMNGLEGYAGMSGEDSMSDGMFETAAGPGSGISGMSEEDFEPIDMDSFGGSFAEVPDGFSDGPGNFDHGETEYGKTAADMAGTGYGARGISGKGRDS